MFAQQKLPDHPAIACALATGYPAPAHYVKCEGCGQEFSGDHELYQCDGALLCSNCTREFIQTNFSLTELAEGLQINCTTAYKAFMEAQEL